MKSVSEQFDIRERVAVVTGASSGLGTTFSEGLAEAGARLVLAARRKRQLDELAGRLRASGGEVLVVPCDVSKEEDVDRLVQVTLDTFGSVDILVNNAGVSSAAPAAEETLAQFRRTMDVNLVGAFLCCQRFGRPMLELGRGSIINVVSVLGMVGLGIIPQASYTASKGGLVNLTRELGAQWARRGVRVNAIAPGFFPSEMTEELFRTDDGKSFVRRRTPMGRPGDPSELLGPLLLLASDASSFMTGQVLVVDGGWTIV